MKTFLEVANKMGPIIPALANQYRPPLPEMNPNVRKGDATEKRKRVTQREDLGSNPKSYSDVLTLTTSPTKTTSNAATASVPQW